MDVERVEGMLGIDVDIDARIEGLHELVLFGGHHCEGAALGEPVLDDAAGVEGRELELVLQNGDELGADDLAFKPLARGVLR